MNGASIEHKLFDLVKDFVSDKMPIGGKVYYRGLRPIASNSTSFEEDAVVAFLTGSGSDIQEGSVVVNVYVSDVLGAKSGMYLKNQSRCETISKKLESFVSYANGKHGDLYFRRSDIISVLEEESIHQHFVSLKLDFKVLNENY